MQREMLSRQGHLRPSAAPTPPSTGWCMGRTGRVGEGVGEKGLGWGCSGKGKCTQGAKVTDLNCKNGGSGVHGERGCVRERDGVGVRVDCS